MFYEKRKTLFFGRKDVMFRRVIFSFFVRCFDAEDRKCRMILTVFMKV